MEDEFGITILSGKKDPADNVDPEEVVEALHDENLRHARSEGFEPREDIKPISFGVPASNFPSYSNGPEGFDNFQQYLNILTGRNVATVELHTRSERELRDIRQSVDVRINAPKDEFIGLYNAMDHEFDLDFASLYYMANGETPAEAYRNAELHLSLGRNTGNSVWTGVAVVEDELEIRNVTTGTPEDTIKAYETLQENGVYHDATIMKGEKGEDEWIVVDNGAVDPDDLY